MNENDFTIVMLDDGETWGGEAQVMTLDKDKVVEWAINEHDWNPDEANFEDIQNEHLCQMDDYEFVQAGFVKHSVDAEFLLEFYLMAKTLGLDTIVNDTIDGVRAAK